MNKIRCPDCDNGKIQRVGRNGGIGYYDCPHCKGTGIEPGVELISAGEFPSTYSKVISGNPNTIGAEARRIMTALFEKCQANARAVGAQEQRKVDAGICRKLAEKKTKTLRELERYGNISNERRINQVTSLFNEAANAIEDNKSTGGEDETLDITPTTDTPDGGG